MLLGRLRLVAIRRFSSLLAVAQGALLLVFGGGVNIHSSKGSPCIQPFSTNRKTKRSKNAHYDLAGHGLTVAIRVLLLCEHRVSS